MSYTTTTELKVALVGTLLLRFHREVQDLFAVPAALVNSTLQAVRTLSRNLTRTRIHILNHTQGTTNTRRR